ncbi:MAG: glycosyltransferase family 4 protein, partial [Okeania sp. SIO2D1]|nr:glycosyltransferase family 4 protein [Okeania sp. SIO2D1]
EQRRIEILRGADVFILPSLVEGLSLALLEAMSCGLACVATDAGADGEVLENGAGIILNTHNVTTQLQTLLPLFKDHPELTTLLGQKARRRVLERYTLSRNIAQLEMLYAEVLRERNLKLSSLI